MPSLALLTRPSEVLAPIERDHLAGDGPGIEQEAMAAVTSSPPTAR